MCSKHPFYHSGKNASRQALCLPYPRAQGFDLDHVAAVYSIPGHRAHTRCDKKDHGCVQLDAFRRAGMLGILSPRAKGQGPRAKGYNATCKGATTHPRTKPPDPQWGVEAMLGKGAIHMVFPAEDEVVSTYLTKPKKAPGLQVQADCLPEVHQCLPH